MSACASVPPPAEQAARSPDVPPVVVEDTVVRVSEPAAPAPEPAVLQTGTDAAPAALLSAVSQTAIMPEPEALPPARIQEPELEPVLVDIGTGQSEVFALIAADDPGDLPYPDIWARLRAGFQLPPIESPLVQRHERWLLENDEFRKAMFERAERYLYYIVEEVDKRGFPMEIALMPAIESAYKPYAYSRARASGLWQFIPSTGRLYGLKTNWWYDGRRDVVASTRAALDYLDKLVGDFDGDWHLAIAAYNAGEGRIMRAIRWNKARGLPTDFLHLRRIKRETKYYVPKLQAMVNIVSHPERYGIELPRIPNAPYFAIVEADSQVDLGVIARLTGMDPDELHYINPGYRRWATHPEGPHSLLVPVDMKDAVLAGLESLPEEQRVHWVRHRVRRGDTLYEIARRYGVTVRAIKRANRLHSSLLRIGQNLMLPISAYATSVRTAAASGKGRAVHRVRRGDTLYEIARHYGITVRALKRANGLRGSLLRIGQRLLLPLSAKPIHTAADTGHPIFHKVRRGETLSEIARRYGVLVRQLAEWNLMDPEDVLQMGRTLKIWINAGPQAFQSALRQTRFA